MMQIQDQVTVMFSLKMTKEDARLLEMALQKSFGSGVVELDTETNTYTVKTEMTGDIIQLCMKWFVRGWYLKPTL